MNQRGGLSSREIAYAIGGAVVAVVLIAVAWQLTGAQGERAPIVAEVNRPAPDFTLPALTGGSVSLNDYRGKVVLINFWGTWCEPCKEETPALQAAYSKLQPQGLEVIGIDLAHQEQANGGGLEAVRQFASRYGVTYPIALDEKGEVSGSFRIYPIPTSFFVDQQGNIRYVLVRPVTSQEIESLFRNLQQEVARR